MIVVAFPSASVNAQGIGKGRFCESSGGVSILSWPFQTRPLLRSLSIINPRLPLTARNLLFAEYSDEDDVKVVDGPVHEGRVFIRRQSAQLWVLR